MINFAYKLHLYGIHVTKNKGGKQYGTLSKKNSYNNCRKQGIH